MNNQNSVENICRQIKEDTEKEEKSILQKAEQHARLRLKLAQGEAKKSFLDRRKEAQGKIDKIRQKALASVDLDKQRILIRAKEAIVDKILAEVVNETDKYRSSDKYPSWLKKLVIEGAVALQQQSVRVLAAKADKQIWSESFISQIQQEIKDTYKNDIKIAVTVDDTMNDIGVVIESDDGRMIYDNTFTTRLDRCRNEIRLIIYKEMFGE